jgi:hypothetical protein
MEALAAAAISMIAPYIAKGAQQFAGEAGEAAFGAVKSLADRLQRWWSGEPVAAAAVEQIAVDPEKYSPIVTSLLASDLAKNDALASEIQQLVNQAQPYVEVVQRMEVANGVTGADIDKLVRGTVRVQQTIDDARDVVGFKAKEVGS